MEPKEVYYKAIRRWGRTAQVTKAIEELLELGQALCKYLNQQQDPDNIAEEIADAEIMLEQLHVAFPELEGKIISWKMTKLRRLEERIYA